MKVFTALKGRATVGCRYATATPSATSASGSVSGHSVTSRAAIRYNAGPRCGGTFWSDRRSRRFLPAFIDLASLRNRLTSFFV